MGTPVQRPFGRERDDTTTLASQQGESMLRITGRELLRNPSAVVGLIMMSIIVGLALLAPVIAPYDPIRLATDSTMQPPSRQHLMGTDLLGRDVLSRVLHGARISLRLGIVSVSIACVFGLTLGLIAGFYGRWIDAVIMRLADMVLAFPSFLLALTIAFALGPSLFNVMIAVGIASIPGYTRMTRGSVLTARELDYVLAARTIGCSNARLMVRHVMPNVIAPIIVISTIGVAWAIITAASLSFLGMGAQPPTPEWGAMINDGLRLLRQAWWISSFPGFAIMLTVVAINLIGDGLRDALDPRLRNIQ
jgi:peptide/nickel transport system permease protein